jgi:uncharacterized membrane protein YphA (DoxX/SURF4 family)
MEILFLIGRILFGGYFVVNGINHIVNRKSLAGYAASKGIPSPTIAVLGSGLLILFGGLGLLFGIQTGCSVTLLALFLVPVTLKMHNFWTLQDPMQRMMEQIMFMKNMALLGAALMTLMIPLPWAYSLM